MDYSKFKTLILAVSGGCDSLALMFLIRDWQEAQVNTRTDIKIATIDHGIRNESSFEVEFVRNLALKFGFEVAIFQLKIQKNLNPEKLRSARYKFLCEYCKKFTTPVLLTAHHADDQIETFLMRLRRGFGLNGLCSIPKTGVIDSVPIIRPLINFKKTELKHYLAKKGQIWIEDRSNLSLNYERNKLRDELSGYTNILEILQNIPKSTQKLQNSREALNFLISEKIQKFVKFESTELKISSELLKLPPSVFKEVLEKILFSSTTFDRRRAKTSDLDKIRSWLLKSSENYTELLEILGIIIRRTEKGFSIKNN